MTYLLLLTSFLLVSLSYHYTEYKNGYPFHFHYVLHALEASFVWVLCDILRGCWSAVGTAALFHSFPTSSGKHWTKRTDARGRRPLTQARDPAGGRACGPDFVYKCWWDAWTNAYQGGQEWGNKGSPDSPDDPSDQDYNGAGTICPNPSSTTSTTKTTQSTKEPDRLTESPAQRISVTATTRAKKLPTRSWPIRRTLFGGNPGTDGVVL